MAAATTSTRQHTSVNFSLTTVPRARADTSACPRRTSSERVSSPSRGVTALMRYEINTSSTARRTLMRTPAACSSMRQRRLRSTLATTPASSACAIHT